MQQVSFMNDDHLGFQLYWNGFESIYLSGESFAHKIFKIVNYKHMQIKHL